MRKGTRTVLSMQNNYKGPPQDVRDGDPGAGGAQGGGRQDAAEGGVREAWSAMGAPRLVEYWEQDPCQPPGQYGAGWPTAERSSAGAPSERPPKPDLGVKIEAQFTVGEYHDRDPVGEGVDGARSRSCATRSTRSPRAPSRCCGRTSRAGSKFFVAKVDPKKVKFESGQRGCCRRCGSTTTASEFALPIRLGLANAKDKQDLIVSILAPGQRYEVANYKNVTIPTNLDVDGRRCGRGSGSSTRRCSTARSSGTRARWSRSTRGTRRRAIRARGRRSTRTTSAMLGADVAERRPGRRATATTASC